MRYILEPCKGVTQGTIFTNAKCNSYSEGSFGILINGRCDFDNPHFENFLYLPVISIEYWKYKELLPLVFRENSKNIKNGIEQKLKNKISYETLLSLESHADEILIQNLKGKDLENATRLFDFIRTEKHFFETDGKCDKEEIDDFFKKFKKETDQVLKKLVNNQLPQYFYMENIDYSNQEKKLCSHYVVLLSEAHSIPKEIAKQLYRGVEFLNSKELSQYFSQNLGDNDYGNLSYACSNLKSPYIEYLIQSFHYLFRIGIDRAEEFSL